MATTDRVPGWYRFGLFEVDERRGEVRKQGLRIRLRGRPFDILLILLERPGQPTRLSTSTTASIPP
jgi:DNA-binding response OmpR family regulator